MSSLLALATDYVEHMANPAYGLRVNEEYSIRFSELLGSERFVAQLAEEIGQLDEPSTLSSYGWLWLLNWSQAQQIPLSDDLLFDLFRESSSVFVKAAVLRQAVRVPWQRRRDGELYEEDGGALLMNRLIDDATEPEEGGEYQENANEAGAAEALLVALMQADEPQTVSAASALLRRRWPGQEQLQSLLSELLGRLDEETAALWREGLERDHFRQDGSP